MIIPAIHQPIEYPIILNAAANDLFHDTIFYSTFHMAINKSVKKRTFKFLLLIEMSFSIISFVPALLILHINFNNILNKF